MHLPSLKSIFSLICSIAFEKISSIIDFPINSPDVAYSSIWISFSKEETVYLILAGIKILILTN